MTVIAKKELLYSGTFGLAAYLSGLIFIDRRGEKGKEAMNNAMKMLKEKNIKLWIFPEGIKAQNIFIRDFLIKKIIQFHF